MSKAQVRLPSEFRMVIQIYRTTWLDWNITDLVGRFVAGPVHLLVETDLMLQGILVTRIWYGHWIAIGASGVLNNNGISSLTLPKPSRKAAHKKTWWV